MRLIHLIFSLALLVLLGAANPVPEPEPHKIHHHRPVKEQRACLDTCWDAGRTKELQPKLNCAACMDRIRDTPLPTPTITSTMCRNLALATNCTRQSIAHPRYRVAPASTSKRPSTTRMHRRIEPANSPVIRLVPRKDAPNIGIRQASILAREDIDHPRFAIGVVAFQVVKDPDFGKVLGEIAGEGAAGLVWCFGLSVGDRSGFCGG
ncbi:hypothetical protein TW65_07092 [Stemphylium lycopersici]|uniref:Uncharacterized protein n=1 Tax=Stemphylium lycopersici TaxID=183478 RepID=A0A364NFS3_STELY|nr:hypothetical protein TW65_07092 [Stemphylium lycopersici]RAR16175.1 hypothetical protein DDE83_000532 [Stemphylium lycopersici]